MTVKKKQLGTTVQGANLWPAPAGITGQDDYKKILVEKIILCLNSMVKEIILCLNSMVREMQLMRSKKNSLNTQETAAKNKTAAKNSMPDITARQKINATSDAKSDAGNATIKRVQYLPVSEALLRKFGRRFATQKIINSLVSRMEKYLTTQKDVISFSNCPVLLPANPSADFIFEDVQKIDVRIYTTFHARPDEAVQPKLNIKNLKFDFMSLDNFKKISDVLENRYDYIECITLRDNNNLKPYIIWKKRILLV